MGSTAWGRLFADHDPYERGFDCVSNQDWCDGFFSAGTSDGFNLLHLAPKIEDLEAQLQIIDVMPELANQFVPSSAKTCQGRTALMIFVRGHFDCAYDLVRGHFANVR